MKKLTSYIGYFLILVVLARILILTQVIPMSQHQKYKAIQEMAGKHPVLFKGSIENPSLYTYDTQTPSNVVSAADSRYTLFDNWKKDLDWWHRKVFMYGLYDKRLDTRRATQPIIEEFWIDNDQSFHYAKADINKISLDFGETDKSQCIDINIISQTPEEFRWHHQDIHVRLGFIIYNQTNHQTIAITCDKMFNTLASHATASLTCFLDNRHTAKLIQDG